MNPLLVIQVISGLVELAPKGLSLYQQITDILKASDEPTAQALLAKMEATYAESGAEADAALADELARGTGGAV
jgi:hypothetical protein